jgi:hypothetical protein
MFVKRETRLARLTRATTGRASKQEAGAGDGGERDVLQSHRGELQATDIDRVEHALDGVEHLVEVGAAHIALRCGDVRPVVLVEREPARNARQHPGVDGRGPRDHRLVGIDEDVDG